MTCSTCTHEHPLSTFTEKQSLAAFYSHTSFLLQCLFTKLCKNQQPRMVAGLCQPTEGSGLTEWSPVKCAFSEHSKTSTNCHQNPGKTLALPRADTELALPARASTEALGHVSPDLSCTGARAHSAHSGDHMNTARPSSLFYPSADH